MSDTISIKCRCGHTNSIWLPKRNHSKVGDPRFAVCVLCGTPFDEEE